MPQPIKFKSIKIDRLGLPGDRTVHSSTPSNKDKKILPGRRQQRHSTEIGCEYHRWWVVRNVLGFETNEHIAGLLLDGFQSALQNLVVLCGGDVFDPDVHGIDTAGDASEVLGSSFSFGVSSNPPGIIEDIEEFAVYKNRIGHYCESIWSTCVKNEKMQHVLTNLSPPCQQFLIKLIGYLRSARGRNVNPTQKRKRPRSSAQKKQNEHELNSSGDCEAVPSNSLTLCNEGGQFQSKNISDQGCNMEPPKESFEFWNQPKEQMNEFNVHPPNSAVLKNEEAESLYLQDSKQHYLAPGAFYLLNNYKDAEKEKSHYMQKNESSENCEWMNYNNFNETAMNCRDSGREEMNLSTNNSHKNQVTRSSSSLWVGNQIMPNLLHGDLCHRESANRELNIGRTSDIIGSESPDLALGNNSSETSNSSIQGTPKVYLDCDSEASMNVESSTETIPSQGDTCLKTLLAKPVKICPESTRQLGSSEGTKWLNTKARPERQEAKPSTRRSDTDGCKPKGVDNKTIPAGINSLSGSQSILNTGSNFNKSDFNKRQEAGLLPMLGVSNQSAALGISSMSSHTQGLGTPVFLCNAGGFPPKEKGLDGSLASLPTLVQNLVYNSSTGSILHPISSNSFQCTSSMQGFPSVSRSSISTPLTLVNPNSIPYGSGQGSNSSMMPLYVAGNPAMGTLHSMSKDGSSLSIEQTSGSARFPVPFPFTPPIIKSHDEWAGKVSGSFQFPKVSSNEGNIYSDKSYPLKITDVRSCGDISSAPNYGRTHRYSTGVKKKSGNNNTEKDVEYTQCQGISGKKLTVFTGSKDAPVKEYGKDGNSCSTNSSTKESHFRNRWDNSFGILSKKQTTNQDGQGHQNNKSKPEPAELGSMHMSYKQAFTDNTSSTAACAKGVDLKTKNSQTPSKTVSSCRSRKLVCVVCQLVFPSGTDLLLHRYEHHSLVCGECDSRFLSNSGLQRHKESDHPRALKCQKCRFVTFTQDDLSAHTIAEHGSKYPASVERKLDPTDSRKTERAYSVLLDGVKNDNAGVDRLVSMTNNEVNDNYFSTSIARPKQLSPAYKSTIPSCDTTPCFPEVAQNKDTENACSESEEPRLIIDMSEPVAQDKEETVVSTSASNDSQVPSDQPLCLVVHSRDSTSLGLKQQDSHKPCHKSATDVGIDSVVEKECPDPSSLGSPLKESDSKISIESNIKRPLSDDKCTVSKVRRKCKKVSKRSLPLESDFHAIHEAFGDPLFNSVDGIERKSYISECRKIGEAEMIYDLSGMPKQNCENSCSRSIATERSTNCDQKITGNQTEDEARQSFNCRDGYTVKSLPPKKRNSRKSPRYNNVDTDRACTSSTSEDSPQHREKEFCSSHKKELKNQKNSFQTYKIASSESEQSPSGGKNRPEAADGECISSMTNDQRHLCPETGCGVSFSRKSSVQDHLERVHVKGMGMTLLCQMDNCQMKFPSRRTLRQHVTETHMGKVRRYTCSWPGCGKGFFARTHLRTHTLVHTGEKPVACSLCDYRCRQRTALSWHMRRQHKIYPTQEQQEVN